MPHVEYLKTSIVLANHPFQQNIRVSGTVTDEKGQDLSTVRAAGTITAPPSTLADMSPDLLFRERGFEFYGEMFRRTDRLSFKKLEDSWTEKTNSGKFKRIISIPQHAIDGASIAHGYLLQNPGY